MPPSTVKKVVLYRFDRQPAEGIVQPSSCFAEGHLEVISTEGNLQSIAYRDLKAVCFVSEMAEPDLFTAHSIFDRRPKTAGLWARFTLKDGDVLDGILPHNLLDWPSNGYLFTPPHPGSNRQRAFVPKLALSGTEFKGVVGLTSPADARRKSGAPRESQINMFD